MTDDSKRGCGTWKFIDDKGTFEWINPPGLHQLYFPLCNEAGIMSSITPTLGGDIKTSQHTFLLLPVSIEDIHNNRSTRNFWIWSNRTGAYSLTGNSAAQNARLFTDQDMVDLTVRGGFLWHQIQRDDHRFHIKTEITSFAPADFFTVEIMWVKVTNLSEKTLTFTPTSAVPIFGRSADNIRDHRHATSLMQRTTVIPEGMVVKPVIMHDERGHKRNTTSYFVAGFDDKGNKPQGQFPAVREFIGEKSSFDWPRAVVENMPPEPDIDKRKDGLEAMGALRFAPVDLKHNQTKAYIILLGITDDETSIPHIINTYSSSEKTEKAFNRNRECWNRKIQSICFDMSDPLYSNWMKWVTCQPVLRKIFGCSFLPHHDYGKGGRGWRDLWQDCLALLLQEPDTIKETLIINFQGIRPDGTNATIIGKGKHEFIADRNRISRVWMDHGVWPYFTIRFYIDQTGDIDILFQNTRYWYDHQTKRAKAVNQNWSIQDGNWTRTKNGDVYKGSLLEHILVQQLTCFFNAGEHNNIKLEDGDWNDQLDMAPDKGETVPFSAFYAGNLQDLASLLTYISTDKNIHYVDIASELALLLDSVNEHVDYDSYSNKQARLEGYLNAVSKGFSGKSKRFNINDLAYDLNRKSEWLKKHIRTHEWIEVDQQTGFFNGYYNNDAERVDGIFPEGIRMNLTAQTFTALFGVADNLQVKKSFQACVKFLKDPHTNGFRLTTPLGPNTYNFGRGCALKYGEKENGAMFSHMAVMYAYALYFRGFVKQGYQVLSSIYDLCIDTKNSCMYPGIPEYISSEGKGKYHYLTGSASWLMMTLITQVFGFRGVLGDLVIMPKLVYQQFSHSDIIGITAPFAGKRCKLTYQNKNKLDFKNYIIKKVIVNEHDFNTFNYTENRKGIRISRKIIEKEFDQHKINEICIILE